MRIFFFRKRLGFGQGCMWRISLLVQFAWVFLVFQWGLNCQAASHSVQASSAVMVLCSWQILKLMMAVFSLTWSAISPHLEVTRWLLWSLIWFNEAINGLKKHSKYVRIHQITESRRFCQSFGGLWSVTVDSDGWQFKVTALSSKEAETQWSKCIQSFSKLPFLPSLHYWENTSLAEQTSTSVTGASNSTREKPPFWNHGSKELYRMLTFKQVFEKSEIMLEQFRLPKHYVYWPIIISHPNRCNKTRRKLTPGPHIFA